MARQLHWTHDPEYSHLRTAPAWYHREPAPFFTPRPSARMEKQAAEERKRQWQSVRDVPNVGGISCCSAFFCPCGAYARSSSRLRSALGGRDVLGSPDIGLFNPDCLQFLVCLPFYGCFLAKLQTTVRAFYGLDGSDVADWFDGCCCPCLTLMRTEHEVVFRETQHQRLKALHAPASSIWEQYKPQLPMTYSKPGVSEASSAHPRAPSPDIDRTALSTIPEANRESISAPAIAPSQPPQSTSPGPSKDDTGIPSNAKHVPLLRYLGRHWYPVPARKNKNKGSMPSDEDQMIEVTEPLTETLTAVKDVQVDSTQAKSDDVGPLVSSRSISRTSTLVTHGMEGEGQIYKDSSLHIHNLVHHEKMNYPTPPRLHSLEDHQKTTKTSKTLIHRLQDDRKASRSTQGSLSKDDNQTPGTSTPSIRHGRHGLEDDQSLISIPTSLAHRLDEDQATQAVPRTVAHALDDDAIRTTPSYASTPHQLDEDDHLTDIQGGSTAHHLEDHAPMLHRSSTTRKPHRLDKDRTVSFEKFATAHILDQDRPRPLGSSSGDSQTTPNKASIPKRAWKGRFGRPTKLPQVHDKAKHGSEDKSGEGSAKIPPAKEDSPPTATAEDGVDPVSKGKAQSVVTHVLGDHALILMRNGSQKPGADEETTGSITHTLGDHPPIPMRYEPEKTGTGEDNGRTSPHTLRDDSLVVMEDETDADRAERKAKEPETHSLNDHALVSIMDETREADPSSKSRKVSTHSLIEDVLAPKGDD